MRRKLAWRDGELTLRMYGQGMNGQSLARQLVEAVENLLPVTVESVDWDLVDMPEIASRVGATRQAVQQWVAQSTDFPSPIGSPGGKRVWDWASVNAWLKRNKPKFADEECGLSRDDMRCLDYWLVQRREHSERQRTFLVLQDMLHWGVSSPRPVWGHPSREVFNETLVKTIDAGANG